MEAVESGGGKELLLCHRHQSSLFVMRALGPLDFVVVCLVVAAIYSWLANRDQLIDSTAMAIQVVFFDMGGVLADDMWQPTEEFVQSHVQWAPEKQKSFKETIRKLWITMKVKPEPTEDWFWQEVFKAHPEVAAIPLTELKENVRNGLRIFFASVAIAERIAKAHKRSIGILSNHQNEWFTAILQRFHLRTVFKKERLIISSNFVECAKPSRDIYEVALKRAKELHPDIKPEQIAFVDDKLENVKAAEEIGFRGINFDARKSPSSELVKALLALGVEEAKEL